MIIIVNVYENWIGTQTHSEINKSHFFLQKSAHNVFSYLQDCLSNVSNVISNFFPSLFIFIIFMLKSCDIEIQ